MARADPALLIAGGGLVCIDEYQKAPIVLDAIKAELNRSHEAGRFLLTGSAQYESLLPDAQALTGRLSRLRVLPLSQGEIAGVHEEWLEKFVDDPDATIAETRESSESRESYIARISAGGFPLALAASSTAARNRWVDNYVDLTLARDVRDISNIRRPQQLSVLIGRLAGQTGQILNVEKAAKDVGMAVTTANDYAALLEQVFLIYRLPAWGKTLSARTSRLPKVHMVDSAIAARLLRLSPDKLATMEATALTELGHLVETFVVGEILKQVSWIEGVHTSGHWNTRDGDEVDLVLERDDGKVLAFEVKAATRVPGGELKPMEKLQAKLGDKFLGGAALYLGERHYTYKPGIHVVPVDRLWTP
ncbi:MAG: DUF4143 domain-containing protein, partial [Actinomycetota bacterium]|nr:DUF4143 domain-containing protein [Actinomycetota bacterium]